MIIELSWGIIGSVMGGLVLGGTLWKLFVSPHISSKKDVLQKDFDKLENQVDKVEAKIESVNGKVERLDHKFDTKFDRLTEKVDIISATLIEMKTSFDSRLQTSIENRVTKLETQSA